MDRTSRCPRCNKYLLYTTTYEPGGKVKRIRGPSHPAALAECPRCHGRWFFFEQPLDIELVERTRVYEPAHTDTMILDNRKGTSPLVRKYTINQEWSKQYDIDVEETDSTSAKASLSIPKGPGFEVTAAQTLKERYAISEKKTESLVDEITIEVPAGVTRQVSFVYKKTVQRGTIRLRVGDQQPQDIDYRVVTGMSFDLSQTDSPGSEPSAGDI